MRCSARYNPALVTSRTPPDPPGEELDELDDEAIVAQQSAAHAPQRRAQVKVESRSVVVSDEDAEATRELDVYTAGTNDPTLVVRDREQRALSRAMQEVSVQPARKKSRMWIAIWGGAGLLALGLGGMIGALHGRGSTPVATASAVAVPPGAVSAPARPAMVGEAGDNDAGATASASAAPALDLDQLPVEHEKKGKTRPRRSPSRRRVRTKRAQPTPPPQKGAIPSGI